MGLNQRVYEFKPNSIWVCNRRKGTFCVKYYKTKKILIGCFAEEYFVGWLVGLEPTTFRTTI